MNIDIGNGFHHHYPPPHASNGVSSVRSSVQRQRLFINMNSSKRNQLPISFDPILSDQRRKGNMPFNLMPGSFIQNTSQDSRGNSGSQNGRAVQIICKKQINFNGGAHQSTGSQSTTRSNLVQNPSSAKRNLIQKIPIHRLVPPQPSEGSPRALAQSTNENKLSGRSNNGGQAAPLHPQRRNVSANASKHPLAFRRQQVMDITDDANTNSMQRLTLIGEDNNNSSRENLDSHPQPFNFFYHGSEGINRFNSKKSLRNLNKQASKHDLLPQQQDQQLFQFTRKQNLMGDNSLSLTRDKTGQQQQIFKLKKASVNNIQPIQSEHQQVPQIGKRKPLIIRKNNFINNQSHANDSSSNTNTILTGVSNRFNNTNNLNASQGINSDASQTTTRYGITQILKSLNSTTQSNDLQNSIQQATNNTSLKDSKLIKINTSKKRLDTARRSRINQITQPTDSTSLQQTSFNSQPPIDTRGLSFLQQKKRSLLIPRVKVDNATSLITSFMPGQSSEKLSGWNGAAAGGDNTARMNSQPPPAGNSQPTLKQIYGSVGNSASKDNKKALVNEETSIVSNTDSQQPQKYIKRGQILRLAKKQTEASSQRDEPDKQQNSLTRVESKKELQTIKPEQEKLQMAQHHLVEEDLIIHENIHDSSCTPLTNQSVILHNSKEQRQETTAVKMKEEKEGEEAASPMKEERGQESSRLKNEGKYTEKGQSIPSQQVETQISSNGRILNNSSNAVKSPIATSTSFKSQNSQQAGQNHDEVVSFPMKPSKALKLFLNQLTDYEKGEILDYQEIYFLGLQAAKVHGTPKNEHNYGYDDEKGDYKVIMKDQIGYRYEVLSFIGKGSFGTALKCFDHKNKEEVALKIVKNKKKYQYQAGIELKILNFLKENDPDDIMNVIHMKDYVIFRKHLCITFELLSMNLFEFLKINDFNGFDHNLIRRFAIQLLYALKYLKEFQIIHCDLKPENILLKEPNKSGIKIIDFGSSTFIDERVYTYIQSRFYRAPEIMLGIPYTSAIDMWSFGCIMAELYIGYPIFPGESENDQMSRIIEMINIPSREVYELSQRRSKFFIEGQSGDYQPIMLKNSRGKLRQPGGKPLSLLIGDEDPDFLDFVERCLEWNPESRLSPDDALRHVWVLKGLPPQVLIHHQRMHNIKTPELPNVVREARDKFFLETSIENNPSQLGGKHSQQQSSHPKSSHGNKQLASSNQKSETIKSLERAQIKNQLHQLNQTKQHNLHIAKGQQLVIHSKIAPVQGLNTSKIIGRADDHNLQKFQTIQQSTEGGTFKRRVHGRQITVKNQNVAKGVL